MSQTIKQLADRLGVSKTAIRRYMDEDFRCKHTETNRNGVITIDADGCNLIAESLGKVPEQPETADNKMPETAENGENIVIPRVVWDALQRQLDEKDRQIAEKDKQLAVKDEQIISLTQLTSQAQILHSKTLPQLPEGKPKESKKRFFGLFENKKTVKE